MRETTLHQWQSPNWLLVVIIIDKFNINLCPLDYTYWKWCTGILNSSRWYWLLMHYEHLSFATLDACSCTTQCTFALIISPDLWKFAEILPDASVQTMPLRFGWGCGTFQTAFHVHVIHIWVVWASSQVMGLWLHTHIITTTDASPEFWELAEILPDASVQTMPHALVVAVEPFQLHPTSIRYIYER